MEINDIAKNAVDTFGAESQIWMAIEEMSELSNALSKLQRGRSTHEEIITEIADVEIMMQQLAYIFGEVNVNNEISKKLQRLSAYVNNTKEWQNNKPTN